MSRQTVFFHENALLVAIGRMMLRESEPANYVALEFADIEGVQARFQSWVLKRLTLLEVADLTENDLGVLNQMSGVKYRLPKHLIEPLSLWRFATYADAVQAGVAAVQQLEMVEQSQKRGTP